MIPSADPTVPSQTQIVALAAELGQALIQAGLMCATAESCTGGLIGHLITENPGSSAYFSGGAMVYSYDAKEQVLGVTHESLMRHGAVSYQVAQEMAQGALARFPAHLAVSVTGVAGPGGGAPDKPTGTVHIHLSAQDGFERAERFVWQSDRTGNKLLSAQAAIQIMLDYVQTLIDA